MKCPFCDQGILIPGKVCVFKNSDWKLIDDEDKSKLTCNYCFSEICQFCKIEKSFDCCTTCDKSYCDKCAKEWKSDLEEKINNKVYTFNPDIVPLNERSYNQFPRTDYMYGDFNLCLYCGEKIWKDYNMHQTSQKLVEIKLDIIDELIKIRDHKTLSVLRNSSPKINTYITEKLKYINNKYYGLVYFIEMRIDQISSSKCVYCNRYCQKNMLREKYWSKSDLITDSHIIPDRRPNLGEKYYMCKFGYCWKDPCYVSNKGKWIGYPMNHLDGSFAVKHRHISCQDIFICKLAKKYLFEICCQNTALYAKILEFLHKVNYIFI